MTFEAWTLSARLAWTRPWIRMVSIVIVLVTLSMCTYFLMRVLPASQKLGSVILHYNLYRGIDEVRTWPWAFLLPIAWISVTFADLAIALGVYRADAHVSWSLLALAVLWSVPWCVALFYLTLINL